MTIDGTTITAVDITADLTQLQSDESNRDRQLQRQGIETATYPTATFKLTQPIELGSVPADGQVVDATATGDLTLHGVTKSVQIPLQARIDGGVISVAGSLPIQFADYGIQSPQGMIVLSVEDHGTLELLVHFAQGLSLLRILSAQRPSMDIDAALPAISSPPRAPRSRVRDLPMRALRPLSAA